jgi:serine/threonine-protein kinase
MSQVQFPELPTSTARPFGRYRILQRIAYGGMAEILLANELPSGRSVVLKRILPHYAANPEFAQAFVHEGRLGQRLRHPNLVQTLAAGRVGQTAFIALEHLRGQTALEVLRAAARAHIEVPLGVAVRVVADAARGLHHAHTVSDGTGRPLGVVHRDVTPHNLFICDDGVCKVLDFGIAKAASQLHHTRSGTIKGKFSYLAPEQIRGDKIDRRVDVFALGIVLHELLTLRPLFRGTHDGETLERVLHLEVPAPEQIRHAVPPALGAVALRALQRDPGRRLPSADALADSLEAVAEVECIDASREVVADLMAELFPAAAPEPPQFSVEPSAAPTVSLGRSSGSAEALDAPVLDGSGRDGGRRAALLLGFGLLAAGGALRAQGCHPAVPTVEAHRAPPLEIAAPLSEIVPPAPDPPSPNHPAESARLRVVTDGPASFVVDGRPQPAAADGALALRPGRHRVAVASPRLAAPRVFDVDLHPGDLLVRRVRSGRGQLRLAVTPWAEVAVDGRALGTTPLRALDLGEGAHVVTLRNAELQVVARRRVVVARNREVLLRVDLFAVEKPG